MKQRKCPACGQHIQITPAIAGTTINCPHCQHRLKVPPQNPPVANSQVAHSQVAHSQAANSQAVAGKQPTPPRTDDTSGDSVAIKIDGKGKPGGRRYRHHKKSRLPLLSGVVCVVCFAAAAALLYVLAPSSDPPQLSTIDDVRTYEDVAVRQQLTLTDPKNWDGKVTFELVSAPSAATLDPQSGLFTWSPKKGSAPERQQVTVRVHANDDSQASDSTSFWIAVAAKRQKPTLVLPSQLSVVAGETLQATIEAHSQATGPLLFSLVKAPSGATIDATSGKLTWSTPADEKPGQTAFTVAVREKRDGGLSTRGQFPVQITIAEKPIAPLLAALKANGVTARERPSTFDHAFDGSESLLRIGGDEIRFFEYVDPQALRGDVLKLAKDRSSLQMDSLPDSWVGPLRYFQKDRMLFVYGGLNADLVSTLTSVLGQPLAAGQARASSALPSLDHQSSRPEVSPTAIGEFTEEETSELLELHSNGQLFRPRNYKVLRAMMAARFARDHAAKLQSAFGSDTEFRQWLDAHTDVKEELFTAIDAKKDDVLACLKLFRSLQEQFPDHFPSYANLAIAIAVTWDNQRAAEMHLGPLRQGKATAPDQPADAADNFAYFVQNERVMQGRAQLLPWELLTHVINHTTPIIERQWVLNNYLDKRVMFGTCYKTVPYDTEMLDSKGQIGRIHGKVYTLPNILRYGGVCAHQADFAARVGKSLGIPAAYVSGQSTYGASHAWVMWVELKSVTPEGISFSLESHGRYRGDKYYVGRLRDPQSGKAITDRQLELFLHTVCVSPVTKRQADWVMNSFATIREQKPLSVEQQFLFLRDTLKLCPENREAWVALSQMATNSDVREKHRKDMGQVLDQLFATFARFPDFTWTIFDDLIAFHESLDKRITLYGRLVSLYELQGRPDLACEARLRLADMLVENKQTEEAIQGLAFSIKKFNSEGRYVPRMLDKLESICADADVAQQHLIPFYHSFLPMIPQMRGSRPSKYCIQMFERGIQRFQDAGQTQLVQLYSAQLQRIRAGQGAKTK